MLFQQLLVGEHPAYHQTATRLVFGWIGKLNDKCTNGLTECRTEQPAATMGFASCNDNGNGTLGHSSSFWHRYWSAEAKKVGFGLAAHICCPLPHPNRRTAYHEVIRSSGHEVFTSSHEVKHEVMVDLMHQLTSADA